MTLYQYRIDLDDLNDTHVRQLRLIGTGRRVLELGCASGAMTEALRDQDCRVVAIEIDPKAAEQAAPFAERMVIADLDQPDVLDDLVDERFDVVLAGDVLEHLRDPAHLLKAAAALLTDDGYVVVSLPNVAHGSVRLGLLQGRWDYTDDGLLDRTHLRFFTRATVEELCTDVGLRIDHLERMVVSPFDVDQQLRLGDFPAAAIEMVSEDPESATLEFVFAAVPADRPVGLLQFAPEPELTKAKADKAEAKRRRVSVVEPEQHGPISRPHLDDVRAVAFYLPQFHPIPENDAWWRPGFTEWFNVTRAQPIWPGHDQPRVPGELGFYDLRLPEVREAQASLAKAYGVSAFCYHHYWFAGRRLLNRPFEEVLASGQPDLPFALSWANEPWTRAWDADRSVLVDQDYNEDERRRHAAWLAEAFNDPRYLRVDGRPLFAIYHVAHLPEPRRYVEAFKEACIAESGLEPYLVQAVTHHLDQRPDQTGCDAEVEFPPHRLGDKVRPDVDPILAAGSHQRYDYEDVIEGCLERLDVPWTRHPCVVPGWDNTARRKVRATILNGATPELYEQWLLAAAEQEARRRPNNGLVFINAWNEWAEGAYLEPDEKNGRAYLEATKRVFGSSAPTSSVSASSATSTVPVRSADTHIPPDYFAIRERVVELEREVTVAFAKGEKTAHAAHQRQTTLHSREAVRLRRVIGEIHDGAEQTGKWARHLEKEVSDKSTHIDDLGHRVRCMEVEVETKNQVLAEAAGYARRLEAEVAAKQKLIEDLQLQVRHSDQQAPTH